MDDYTVTWQPSTRRFLQLCMGKISYDGGETWWPRGPYRLHIAGETYALCQHGGYILLREDEK